MPNSVLWVFLIVVWLFVLVPMVLRGRPAARTSSKAAAQTRVVHRGGSRSAASRRAASVARAERAAAAAKRAEERRAAKAAEADSTDETAEPDVDETVDADEVVADAPETVRAETAEDQTAEDETGQDEAAADDISEDEPVEIEAEIVEDDEPKRSTATLRADVESAVEVTDVLDVVDVEVVDLDEAQASRVDPLGSGDTDADDLDDDLHDEADEDLDDEYEDAEYGYEDDDLEDEYEYEDDLDEDADSEFEILDEDDEHDVEVTDVEDSGAAQDPMTAAPKPKPRELRGRGGLAPGHVQEREEAAYRERRRVVAGLTLLTVVAIVSAFFVQPLGYVFAAAMVVVFAGYLVFLRRAVRAEHVRHAQRIARQRRRQAEEARVEREQAEPLYVAPPPRLRRPGGAIVLEIDDEDPAFDHLPTYDFGAARGYDVEFDDTEHRHRTAV